MKTGTKGTLPVSALIADQIVTDRLRLAGGDTGCGSAQRTHSPVPSLSEGETVIVPLQLELRPAETIIPDKDAVEGAKAQYLAIQKYGKSVLVQREDNHVIQRSEGKR